MIKDKTFRITFKKANGEEVTRFGKFDDKCRYWTSKIGTALITYFDLDKQGVPYYVYYDLDNNGYRTATASWKVRY